ncbi:DUF11 domain-containing protein [Calycomorphotria hydatis]|uniref:Large cysteine-rich periplasmic protein OmcB n=1 Tax=Calycomorphotria hydatis TaxID=2528027 RepID=A0A517T3U2_9PLAN|nr:DUF11 domain-containing protein [Calycomorphotria hydatis]QDT63045.1 Large cysteine-rich periplasmic protein OmcB precursor [Calycomorphotria hydatis]
MRLRTFILASCGIVCMAFTVGLGQDGFVTGGRTGAGSQEAANTLSQGTAPTNTGLKNYYQALFGKQAPQTLAPNSEATQAQQATSRKVTILDNAVQPAAGNTENMGRGAFNANFVQSAEDTAPKITQVGGYKPAATPAAGSNPFAALDYPAAPSQVQSAGGFQAGPQPKLTVNTPPATTPSNRIRLTTAVGSDSAANIISPPVPTIPAANPSISTVEENTTAIKEAAAYTGRQSSGLTLEWTPRGEINVGQECQLDLIVTNTGETAAKECEIDAYFPATVRLLSTDPTATDNGDHITWKLGSLDAGKKQIISTTLMPSARGDLNVAAFVRTLNTAGAEFTVREPLLVVDVSGPDRVVIGDPATHTIKVNNPGTGTAKDVLVEAIIPEGLEHAKGKRLSMNIGSLSPGETRVIRLALAAIQGGSQAVSVTATAGGLLKQVAQNETFVVAPSLRLEIDGPGLRYVGREATYTLNITNDGPTANNNVRVSHKIPEGFEFVSADQSGRFDKGSRLATWFVGRLNPGESKQLHCNLEASKLGDFVHHAGAISEHGARAETSFATSIDGTASLVLEIFDLDDPVEVGVETAYEVRLKNEGTKASNNVDVSCKLPPGVTLIDTKAPTQFRVEGSVIFFKPLETLAPGKTASYVIRVKGEAEGNHRFRARLASDSVTEPLIFEELTKFYRD